MSNEFIAITLYVIMYGGFWLLYITQIRGLQKENNRLREELLIANHSLAIYNAAKEGDLDTARLMAAHSRDLVKTKPPVPSAGAKENEKPMTGLRIIQSG